MERHHVLSGHCDLMAGIICETSGEIGWLVIDRPTHRNALTTAMWRELPRVVEHLDADDAVRVIIMRGAGEAAFAAGADILELQQMGDDPDALAAFEHDFEAAQASIENASKPVIAAVRGPCMGGGMALALACDMRIAADDASFAIPAARLGLGYAAPAVARLMRVVGAANAFEVLATARRLSASEAMRMGLITQVTDPESVFAQATKTAEQIARNAPLTVRAAKATIAALVRDRTLLRDAEMLIAQCGQSADFAEGRKAFAEKREPRFQGR